MCDICREHDRQNRKNKKLRELGGLPPLRFHVSSVGQSKSTDVPSHDPSPSIGPDISTSDLSSNDANEVLMDLLLPETCTSKVRILSLADAVTLDIFVNR